MTRQPVESSQIASIGYDADTKTMEIEFVQRDPNRKPSIYQYANVDSEDYINFLGADSIGRHFGAFIKPFPQKYPYTKIQ